MRLYITEKPSLGRALAEVLPQPQQRQDGYIQLANGDIVSWCIGHLLEQVEPDQYDINFKQWRLEHLPIIPEVWQMSIKASTAKQFKILQQLINQAEQLVNVGDPDREGQLLVDEVIQYCGVSKEKQKAALRCLINDLNPDAIIQSLANLKNNTDFVPLSTSALARTRADWLYGINMTRMCTIKGRFAGHKGVLSIGRVQTPLLGLVVNRDHEIENFVSKPFYELKVDIETEQGLIYQAKWKPSEACEPYMDEEGRVIYKPLVELVIKKITAQQGKILSIKKSLKKQAQPLLYNLSALQIDAARKYNMTAQQVLDICQQLYEQYKLITYPRSDCNYLPAEHYAQVPQILAAIKNSNADLADIIEQATPSIKTKVWNDKKVTAHHAIIPTSRIIKIDSLAENVQRIYNLIAKRYICQFYPEYQYQEFQVDTELAGGLFISKLNQVKNLGWKVLEQTAKTDQATTEHTNQNLTKLKQGMLVTCIDTHLETRNTMPPKHFTDATLLAAMTNIARFVQNPVIKKILRDTDGIGTEATRAGIIELLFKRGYLIRKGREIRATEIAKQLVTLIPNVMTQPDMTAEWELKLEEICKKKISYKEFMQKIVMDLNQLTNTVKNTKFSGFK